MTRTKKTTIRRTIGDKIVEEETIYYEVGIGEMESALKEISNRKDEKIIREELIKNSKW